MGRTNKVILKRLVEEHGIRIRHLEYINKKLILLNTQLVAENERLRKNKER